MDMGASDSLEDLLARAIAEVLDGRAPDVLALAGGDSQVAGRLEALLQDSVHLIPAPPRGTPPRRIGPWLVERELGRGGMGTVVAAVHENSRRRAAVKFLPPPFAFLAESRERFRREGLALSRVRHPHVVPILEVGEHDGIPFVCMQLMEGGSLSDLLHAAFGLDAAAARRRASERLKCAESYELRIARLFAGAAAALSAIHSARIVHRDVKPSNLLLGPDGELLLSDFGLAQQVDLARVTRASLVVGTPQYLAPELTRPAGKASPASDTYALGVSLYELLTFRSPFAGQHEESLLRAIREQEPRHPSRWNRHVSRDLETVCLHAIEKRPEHRYHSAEELARDLRAVAERRPITARRASRLRLVSRRMWAQRRPIATSLGSLLVLGAVVFGVFRWQEVRAARDRIDYVRSFQKAQALLVNDFPGTPREVRDPPLHAAAELLETCTRLQPREADAWLSRADVAVRLGRASDAERFLDLASDGGSSGWYPQYLRRQARGSPAFDEIEFPPGEVANVCRGFRPLERMAVGAELRHRKRYLDAFEILTAPDVLRDPLVLPDLLLAACIHGDALFEESHSNRPQIFADRSLAARMALAYYDQFLARGLGEQPLAAFNRSILIRDASSRGFDLGKDRERLLDEAEQYFEREVERDENAETVGHWIAMLVLRARWSEAAERGIRSPREWLLAMDESCFRASLTALVATRRYLPAWEHLTARPPANSPGGSGAFFRLVSFHELALRAQAASFDGDGILALAEELDGRIPVDDLCKGLELLDDLNRRFASSPGEDPR